MTLNGVIIVVLLQSCMCLGEKGGLSYVNGGDKLLLRLSNRKVNHLQGPPGQSLSLEFIVVNNGPSANFWLRSSSELGGRLNVESTFLTTGQQQTVQVKDMMVPRYEKEGTVLRFSLFAFKDRLVKRSDRGDQRFRDSHSGNDNEAVVHVEYVVTNKPIEDEDGPRIILTYDAQSADEACSYNFADEDCITQDWRLSLQMNDEQSGLHIPTIVQSGTLGSSFSRLRNDPIRYRYENYPMGTIGTQKMDIEVTCCLDKVRITARDIVGHITEIEAVSTAYGKLSSHGISETLMYSLIVAAIAFFFFIMLAICCCCCCCRKRYKSVPQS